jgi:uncharacterized delta-60 repeat protein
MKMQLGVIAALVLAPVLGGCGGGGSSSGTAYIDVTVNVDPALLPSLDQVVIRADAPSRPEFTKPLAAGASLSWTIAVVNVNSDFVAQLAADGNKSGALVLTYKAQAAVSAGQHTAAVLKLDSRCVGATAPTCPSTQTCDSGTCVAPPMFGTGSDGGTGGDGGGTIDFTLGSPTAFVRRGSSQTTAVNVNRGGGSGPVTVTVSGPVPTGVTADPLTIPAGSSTGSLVLHASATAAEGATTIAVNVSETGGFASGPLRVLVGDAPGTLDTSFAGTGTFVPTVTGMVLIGRALILDNDGVIVTGSTTSEAVTVRVRGDGTLDPAFGSGGVVSTGTGSFSEGIGLMKLQSGRIVVVGVANGNAAFTAYDFGLFGYTSAGALDPGFGNSGVANFAPGVMGYAELYNVADSGEGTLIVSGVLFPSDGTVGSSYGLRYSTAGVRDTTFSISAASVYIQTQAIQPNDHKIVLAGGTTTPDFWLARYTTSGAPDSGFGTNGVVTTSFSPDLTTAYGLAVFPNGNLLAIGTTNATPGKVVLARYNLNGSLDLTFGAGGKVTTAVAFNTRSPNAAIVDASGRIAIVGLAGGLPAVARFGADGSVDTTFGTGGVATVDFGISGMTTSTGGYGIVIDADGRILIAADIGAAGNQHMGIARLWP